MPSRASSANEELLPVSECFLSQFVTIRCVRPFRLRSSCSQNRSCCCGRAARSWKRTTPSEMFAAGHVLETFFRWAGNPFKIVCCREICAIRKPSMDAEFLLSSGLTNFLQAQAPPPEPAQSVPQQISQEELNRLLAPIALYPDALVALILPASTVPSDLVLAARYIASNGDPAQVATTVGRQYEVARTLSGCSKMDGPKPRVDDGCGRGVS